MSGTDSALSRLKRLAGLTSEEELPYVCLSCETGYDVQYHVCPNCGSYAVERRPE
ncbi:hydrogenase maturation nickel metallochaperone HypA [Haloprofundus sp. MHR1]|nr:hydrogenase maturation nickel metallochaperone HypA [Haloprofundus sp. MHR1]